MTLCVLIALECVPLNELAYIVAHAIVVPGNW